MICGSFISSVHFSLPFILKMMKMIVIVFIYKCFSSTPAVVMDQIIPSANRFPPVESCRLNVKLLVGSLFSVSSINENVHVLVTFHCGGFTAV